MTIWNTEQDDILARLARREIIDAVHFEGVTANATPTELFLVQGKSKQARIGVPDDCHLMFTVDAVGRTIAPLTTVVHSSTRVLAFEKLGPGTLAAIGTPPAATALSGAANQVAVAANTTKEWLECKVTGTTANIHWVVRIRDILCLPYPIEPMYAYHG